ncbi:Hypothetical predicted protein [Octopus vulgaris]|uniref:Uncharacterized protein n=1 Tax=Octopus vulgaris TaxID=6645 RepID=A0AA36BM49_OCTVU|nr:Hypothetical predicted protein [Octopus vulgaris]
MAENRYKERTSVGKSDRLTCTAVLLISLAPRNVEHYDVLNICLFYYNIYCDSFLSTNIGIITDDFSFLKRNNQIN